MSYEKVKYKLINHDTNQEIWLESDPVNWDNSEKTLKRDSKTHGMYTQLSKNLEFVKDGAVFLIAAYAYKDIEADVEIYEYRFHPKTSHPYLHSTGVFDFSDYSATDLKVKVPFKSGGLNALIKAQIKEKFELERLESINGNVIDAIEKQTVALTSRKIFLVTQFDVKETDNSAKASVESNSGGIRHQTVGIPLAPISKSHEQAQYVIPNSVGIQETGTATMMFFLNADRYRKLNIEMDISFNAFVQQYEQVEWALYQICMTTYSGGESLTLKERRVLSDLSDRNEYPNQGFGSRYENISGFTVPMSATYKDTIELEQGDSIALECYLISDMQNSNNAGVRVDANDIVSTLSIEEDSEFDDSQTKAVYFKDMGEKLMQIITGQKTRYYSDFYTNSEYSKTAATLGFWIRQFYEKNVEVSLSDFLETSAAIHHTGYGVDIVNGVETLIHEDKKFFFHNSVAIDLPYEVTNYEEKAAKEFCNASLEFGYKKGGDYEEAMGLDEYNIKTGFTTPLKRVESKYSQISPMRADSYAKEFARRKQKDTHPTTDTPYDKDLHLLDLKTGLGENLQERIYSDDFEELPTGVYSPETATNLRLTPSQIEQRHEWFYGSALLKQKEDKIRYSNTEGNNLLTTKEEGKDARTENQDVNISDLEKALFAPTWVEFEHPIDYYVNEQLNGRTEVEGRSIPNIYFKVRYRKEGKSETGYLFQHQQKQSDIGKFKILKSI